MPPKGRAQTTPVSGVTIGTYEGAWPKRGRTKKPGPQQFLDAVQNAYDAQQGMVIGGNTLDDVRKVQNQLRRAATELDKKIKFYTLDDGSESGNASVGFEVMDKPADDEDE